MNKNMNQCMPLNIGRSIMIQERMHVPKSQQPIKTSQGRHNSRIRLVLQIKQTTHPYSRPTFKDFVFYSSHKKRFYITVNAVILRLKQ